MQQVALPCALLLNMIQLIRRQKVTVIPQHQMIENGGSKGLPPLILHLGTTWGEWLASSTNRFDPAKWVPGTHRVGGWVGPKFGLDTLRKRKTTFQGLNHGTSRSKASYYTDRATQAHRLYVLHIHYKMTHVHRDLSLDSWYLLQMREGLRGHRITGVVHVVQQAAGEWRQKPLEENIND